jgi:hypothetical protein
MSISDDITLYNVLSDQITHLEVEIEGDIIVELPNGNVSNLFSLILCLAKRLTNLNISQSFCYRSLTDSTFKRMPMHHASLTALEITVNTFDDCLYILSGDFPCLSTLIIDVLRIENASSNIYNLVSII